MEVDIRRNMSGYERDLKRIEKFGKILWDVFINFRNQCARYWISPTKY